MKILNMAFHDTLNSGANIWVNKNTLLSILKHLLADQMIYHCAWICMTICHIKTKTGCKVNIMHTICTVEWNMFHLDNLVTFLNEAQIFTTKNVRNAKNFRGFSQLTPPQPSPLLQIRVYIFIHPLNSPYVYYIKLYMHMCIVFPSANTNLPFIHWNSRIGCFLNCFANQPLIFPRILGPGQIRNFSAHLQMDWARADYKWHHVRLFQ